ncbi:X-Pro dipeptidyl-peptidase [Acrocarpospora pleiomorpha]|uniref:X-Pro dipeptidyl-peptidase n=1 Tax=Acrocarpospora pleiomorpha TaxID=90975 RepID=A0A5M3XFF6_9ACTN|nr:CocE/NonD family hydrolase [Acrocarpospora pleiomorpha]GES19780.1 X-Pro dipeptidyl-peptidase [Acrocarpospora pleiomorpha]
MNRFNLRLPGWDGTPLAVDVRLPDALYGPVPTVVTRTPYGRNRHLVEGTGWARRGFAYVVQDVRGRYDSDGVWECYRNERGDGAALADWICAQEWSDGRLIGYGGSYSGYTAWALAVERPEAVAAVVSMGPSMALHRTKFEDGVLRLAEHAAWWLERADGRTSRDGLTALLLGADPGALAHLPVIGLPDRIGANLPGWADVVLDGPHHQPKEEITERELAALPVPGLHIGGWYDLLVEETLLHWRIVGSTLTPRPPQRLVIGPWGHDLAFTGRTRYGDRDHGPHSLLDLGALQVAWLRDCLDGTARAEEQILPIGGTNWLPWPQNTTTLVLYGHPDRSLHPGQPEATLGGFVHDPGDPYPSLAPGADRKALDERSDVLRFATPSLPDPLTFTAAEVHLEVTAPVEDVDWIVRLTEHTADGRVFELARGRAGGSGRLVLSPVAATLLAGSRLRLEISGSDFPRLALVLGTGADRYTTTATASVRQHVHAARLVLETS